MAYDRIAMFGTRKTIIFQLANNIDVISEKTCVIVHFVHCQVKVIIVKDTARATIRCCYFLNQCFSLSYGDYT